MAFFSRGQGATKLTQASLWILSRPKLGWVLVGGQGIGAGHCFQDRPGKSVGPWAPAGTWGSGTVDENPPDQFALFGKANISLKVSGSNLLPSQECLKLRGGGRHCSAHVFML